MQCPVCKDVTLAMSERQGIEIDYCPSCRGVWLDRGELDKIITRVASELPQAVPVSQEAPRTHPASHQGHYPPKRRKNFWEELFD